MLDNLKILFATLKARVLYAAKAIVVALGPIVGELIDNLAVDLTNWGQGLVTVAVSGLAVYFTPNADAPVPKF